MVDIRRSGGTRGLFVVQSGESCSQTHLPNGLVGRAGRVRPRESNQENVAVPVPPEAAAPSPVRRAR